MGITEKDLLNPQKLNRYAYSLNNPYRYVDPDGRVVWDLIDYAFFAHSAYKFAKEPSWSNAGDLGLDAIGLLPIVPSLGVIKAVGKGLNKFDDAFEGGVVIGKMADLNKPGALREGERLLDLPNKGSYKANWRQNSSRLREAMSTGKPIRDASINPITGELENNTGFLRAERNLLKEHGWTYDSKARYWNPPSE